MSSSIDLAYLNSIAAGDKDFVHEILKMFLTHTISDFNEMKDAFAAREIEKSASLAHKMKSSVTMLGNEEATNLVMEIEDACRAQANPDMDSKISRLGIVIDLISGDIKHILQTA